MSVQKLIASLCYVVCVLPTLNKTYLNLNLAKRKGFATTVYVEGPMSADTLQDLVCSCNGTSPCKKSCACFEENLACTDVCFCQGSEWCNMHKRIH